MLTAVGRVIWRLLRRLYSSATIRTRSHPSIEELRTRIDDLETLDEHLSRSLEALVTEYETICGRAASADADQALRHELSQVILCYRSYRKQRQYAQLACNYYRKALQLLQDSTNDTETVALVDRLLSHAEEWDRKRTALGARPQDLPHRWKTTYHFSTTSTWSPREQRQATSRAESLLESARQGHAVSALEDVISDLFGDNIPSVDPDALLARDAVGLGDCPACGLALFTTDILVEYETTDRESAAWAVCPECEDIVRPAATTETAVSRCP